MPKGKQDPYSSYDIDDWKWEFLRRNPRYRRAARAIEWLRRTTSAHLKGFGIQRLLAYKKLEREVESRYGDSLNISPLGFLPSHDIPAHPHKEKPLRISPHAVYEINRWVAGDLDGLPPMSIGPQEHELAVVIDTRHSANKVFSELKEILQQYKSKQRDRISNYKVHLEAWDLRQKGWTDSQIARKLWPKDWKRIGGRDPIIGVKGALIQRVYDHEHAAQKLIDESFPPKNRTSKIKK